MMKLIVRWILAVIALVVSAFLTNLVIQNGIVLKVGDVSAALGLFVAVALLALVNATLGKILKLLVLPLNCLTLGLLSIVINALLFWLVGSWGWNFEVKGFLPGLIGSVLYSAANAAFAIFLPDEEKNER
jgi:putative membrane protein